MTRCCLVDRVPMRDPGDVSGVERVLAAGGEIVAILGKTEGNGGVNDFSRAYAVSALKRLLGPGAEVPMVMSGGTEGGLSPHFLVFRVMEVAAQPAGGALAIGTARTRDFRPEEIGRPAQVEATAEAVQEALRAAAIAGRADVHYVQVKCPLLTSERVAEAQARGQDVVTTDSYKSMAYSRGASALGVALALGEVAQVRAEDVCGDPGLWSARAATSAGVELLHNEIVAIGNSAAWAGPLRIAHGVMRDAIDSAAVWEVLRALGFAAGGQLAPDATVRVRAVLVKAEASRSGRIRGQRHIMWDDTDISATRHARALVGGVVAGVIGQTDLFVSGGAEHQGPDGGGPIAIIAETAALVPG
jgi:cyanuric acid amidohydrolase